MSYYAIDVSNSLSHHGILGMKWGVRRYQNEDGSLTSAGRLRYYGAGGDRKGYYREKGASKRYRDAMKSATRHHKIAGFTKDYHNWVKVDPKNRAGQKAQYESERMTKMLGGKKSAADARYAYDHKRLANYINRDGSLTTAGKIRYYGAGGDRKGYYNQIGSKKMQRDIERDKNSLTTSEKVASRTSKRLGMQRANLMGRIAGRYANPAVAAAVVGRQKDPTKYVRKNARNITKSAIKLGINAATGNVIGGLINGEKLAYYSTIGTGKALRKTANRVAGNAIRGTAGANIIKNNYNARALSRKTKTNVNESVRQAKRDANNANYLPTASKVERAALSGANKASQGVAKAAKYYYDTNMQTVRNVTGAVTGKKKKRN